MRYSFSSPVRFCEVDQNAVLTLPALVNYFQDVAALQAEHLGIGTGFLARRGQGWLLLSWQIIINSMPPLAAQVTSTTWAYDFKQMMAGRNFTLTGEEGELYAYANSMWMLFDFVRQKPVRVPEEEKLLYDPEQKLKMEYSARKILPSKELSGEKMPALLVTQHQLDTNHHVNNGQYIQMAVAAAGEMGPVGELRAEYRSQALQGDLIVPVVYREQGQTVVSLESEDGKPYCVVQIKGHA